jgi:photosystem II stability/assembly factor-like uncharacterized protein
MGVGFTFTERRPTGSDANYNWFKSRCSADGRIVFAEFYATAPATGGRLYRSTDYGEHWTQINPSGVDEDFNANGLDCSYDGKVVVAGSNNAEVATSSAKGRLYVSVDYGVTWNEIRPHGDVDISWNGVTVSGDGGTLLLGVAAATGRLYKSAAPFSSFTELRPKGDVDRNWRSVGINYDGTVMFAGCVTVTEGAFISTDGGANWSDKHQNTGVCHQMNAGMSRDGSCIVWSEFNSAATDMDVYFTKDLGANISAVEPSATGQLWRGTQISQDGQKLLAVSATLRAWFSYDQGANWTELRPAGDADKTWRGVGMSSRGDRIFLTSLTRFWSGVELDPTTAPTAGGGSLICY